MKTNRRNRYYALLGDGKDGESMDPLDGLANLFDAAMVLAVALMVAFAVRMKMTEFLTGEDATFVKNAGKENMEIIVKKENKITRYKASESSGTGKGYRVGIAYQMENGDVIYVPEKKEAGGK